LQAATGKLNLVVLGLGGLSAVALQSWSALGLGGAAYLALAAWDLSSEGFWKRVLERRA